MKKIIIALFVFASISLSSAARPSGLRVGGGGSANFYNANSSEIILDLDNTQFYGGFVEVGYDWKFSQHSTLCVGGRINAVLNGNVSGLPGYEKRVFTAQLSERVYLDIPLMYQFAFNVGKNVQLFIAAGPTANFWLTNGTVNVLVADKNTGSSIEYVNWFKDNNYYNRVNLSLGGQAGVYFHHVKIYAGYDQALTGFINKNYSPWGQLRIGAAYIF